MQRAAGSRALAACDARRHCSCAAFTASALRLPAVLGVGSISAAMRSPRSRARRSSWSRSRMPLARRDLLWLSEGSAVLLTDDLSALGVPAITRDDRLRAFERLRVPRVATLSHATVIRLGQVVGAAQVVVGTFELQGDEIDGHARERSGSTRAACRPRLSSADR